MGIIDFDETLSAGESYLAVRLRFQIDPFSISFQASYSLSRIHLSHIRSNQLESIQKYM